MKTIKFLILILFVCCTQEPSDKEPYYQFSTDDSPFLFEIPINANNDIQFKNQEGVVLTYNLTLVKIEKLDYSIGNFWGNSGGVIHYFDEQTLEFDSKDYSLPYPAVRLTVIKRYDGGLEGRFYFHRWNDSYCLEANKYYSINDIKISSMTFDDIVYEKVITIHSESDIDESEDGIPKNVITVYIDLKRGLIGFDDLESNTWRLIKT